MQETSQTIRFVVRPATRDDVPAIAAIYADAVLEGSASFEIAPPDEAEMGRRVARILELGLPYLVAEQDREVVGYAYAGPYHTRPGYRFTLETSIYVSPRAQRGGIGAALLEALIDQAEALGYRQMIAVIGDEENAGSVAVHRRFGFRHVGVLKSVGRKHGRWLSSVLMQRALGEGDDAPPAYEP